jgi:hypothetical protein
MIKGVWELMSWDGLANAILPEERKFSHREYFYRPLILGGSAIIRVDVHASVSL